MRSRKVVILGAGHVGSHAAYALAQEGLCSEIVLVDIDKDKAVSQALDVDDSIGFAGTETVVRAGEYSDVSDAAVVINAIGEGRKPGQTRLDLLGRSAEMAEELIRDLKPFGIPGIFVSITNPCDVIADYMRKGLGLPRERAFGTGTLLDTARLVRAISRRAGVGRKSVQAYSLGEHGDSSMIPFSSIRIGGLGFREFGLSEEELLEDTRQSGMIIIEGKKSTEFGIGSAAADLVRCIFLDEKRILPASVLLQGEYGESEVHCGVPCRIGAGGIEKIIELPLSEKEKEQLHHSCEIIREHIALAAEKGGEK
ncbi:MAG: L-lactate dehydrogenase [Stomatobaculum sp.]|nr:L-lactate dehydrogenase [Stomatobaculum sp.]